MSTLNREIYISSLPFLPRLTSVLQCSPQASYRFLYVILSANPSLLPFQKMSSMFIPFIQSFSTYIYYIGLIPLILVFILCLSPTWSFSLLLVLICVYCLSVRFLHCFAYECRVSSALFSAIKRLPSVPILFRLDGIPLACLMVCVTWHGRPIFCFPLISYASTFRRICPLSRPRICPQYLNLAIIYYNSL
jgi:hypothetical protein